MLVLPDQRVREQRLADVDAPRDSAARDREPLVGGDVLDEPEQLGRERRLGERRPGRRGPTRAGTSTTSSSARPASVPSLRTSTTCTASPRAGERGDDAGRRLAVERAAALLEQRRLLVQRRVAVELQQLPLDLRHRGRARHALALLGQHLVVRVEVAQVVRGDRRRARRAAAAAAEPLGQRVAVVGEQPPQHVGAVEPHRADPREVVEADLVDHDPLRRRRRAAARPARWNVIATLQSPTARWPASSSARVTMPTGLVKSTIQAPGAARCATCSAISSTTGTVRSAFASPPAPVVSCPMQPHGSGSVSSRSRASWPPTRIWISTKSAPSSARSSSPVTSSRPPKPARSSIRRASAADDLAALVGDVVQRELRRRRARRARNELGRVGRPAADDRELHSFTPVSVTPSTNAFWARKNSSTTGASNMTSPPS